METKRNKQWRKKQCFRMFRKRIMRFASYAEQFVMDDGRHVYRPRWEELAKCHWAFAYKTTGKPCSCWVCQGESFNRRQAKKEAKALIEESEMQ